MIENRVVYKSVFPGKFIQGEGLIAELGEMMNSFGEKGLILASSTVKRKVLDKYSAGYSKSNINIEKFKGECSEKEINRVMQTAMRNNAGIIAGAGGGKVIDTAKIVADRLNIPVIIVPTIASTDAPCSGCAVIYTDDGVFESVAYQKMNPQVVLADMNVIAEAPVRFLVAGMGDALATWFEARSCERSKSKNECGGLSSMAGLALAKLCYDMILEHGVAAKRDCQNKTITPALYRIVEANILLSGIGFESSGLAAAHAIHNGLSALEETHAYYHGEKVAFGTLAGLHLSGAPTDEMDTVYSFCIETGLPVTLSDIGLGNATKEELMKAAEKACAPQDSIHHEVGNITPGMVLNAMIDADETGRMKIKNK